LATNKLTKQSSPKICIITTVHQPFDTRIFHKQARSLVKAGYQVTLIARHGRDETVQGVQIKALPQINRRLTRFFYLTILALRLALKQRAAAYHLHDPELLPMGLVLRLMGKTVIYDVHEDNYTFIKQKEYLPRIAQICLPPLFDWFERGAARWMKVCLAEKYYRERFPRGRLVLNYPLLPDNPLKTANNAAAQQVRELLNIDQSDNIKWLLYTGNVLEERGALLQAAIPKLLPSVGVCFVGECPPELADKMRAAAGDAADRLIIYGVGHYVPREIIDACYIGYNWLAGLAIFPPTEHYVKKELTKFFEYMLVGLPILCSNFPYWQAIVQDNGYGLAVDPGSAQQIVEAIEYIDRHAAEAELMGQRGREAVLQHYNWSSQERNLLELYQEIFNLTYAN